MRRFSLFLALMPSLAVADTVNPPVVPSQAQPVITVDPTGAYAGGNELTTQANASEQTSVEGATGAALSTDLSRNLRVIDASAGAKLDQLHVDLVAIGNDSSPSPVTQSGTWTATSNALVVGGDQAYIAGQYQPLSLTSTGRLKVGLSSATNIVPGAIATATTTADLVACRYVTAGVTFSDQNGGAMTCNATGALRVDNSGQTQPVSVSSSALPTNAAQETGGNLAALSSNLGTQADTACPTGTGTCSLIGLTKYQNSITHPIYLTNSLGTAAVTTVQANGTDMVTGANALYVAQFAASAIPTTFYASTGVVGKSSNGSLYHLNVVNGSAAGYLVVANLTTVPASGASIAASQMLWCMPVAANAGVDLSFAPGIRATTGIVVMASTSCTTYTPVGVAPVSITVMSI